MGSSLGVKLLEFRPLLRKETKISPEIISLELLLYTYISLIIDELYQEFSLMKAQGRTPREFGIKVREHPENIAITAKNKMRKAASTTVQVGLWGRETRHSMSKNDEKTNHKNFIIADDFLTTLFSKNNYRESDKDLKVGGEELAGELGLSYLYEPTEYEKVKKQVQKKVESGEVMQKNGFLEKEKKDLKEESDYSKIDSYLGLK